MQISAFKNKKINKIEKLKPVKRINKYIKRNNVVILIILFKFDQIITFVTVKNKKTFGTFSTRFNMLVKVFNLFET